MKNIFAILFLLGINLSFAQTITMSELIALRNDIAYHILGDLGGRTLLLRDKATSFEVVGFDQNMKEAWTKELELDKRQPKIIYVLPDDNHFSIVYKYRQKSDLITKIHKYGPGANLIDSVTIKDYGYLFYSPSITVVRSEDRSKLLLFYIEKQSVFNFLAFDIHEMKLLWETSIIPPDFAFFPNYHDAIIDNDGNMVLILEKNNYKASRETHYYEFHYFKGDDKQLISFNIPMQGRLTYDARFSFDHLNGSLVGTGFYSEKNVGRADGAFYLNITPTDHKKFRLSFNAFEKDFLLTLLGKDGEKNKGVPDIEIVETVLRRDGGVILIAEKNRTLDRGAGATNRSYYDSSVRFAIDYYYEDIMAFSMHPTGEAHWSTVLHKKQYSQDDDAVYSSFFLFKTGSNLRFLFNDEIKYENTVSEYVLDGNGNFERNSLLSTERLKLRLRFKDALQVNSNKLIIPSESRNRIKLVRLEY
jgi:hypothetical protein